MKLRKCDLCDRVIAIPYVKLCRVSKEGRRVMMKGFADLCEGCAAASLQKPDKKISGGLSDGIVF